MAPATVCVSLRDSVWDLFASEVHRLLAWSFLEMPEDFLDTTGGLLLSEYPFKESLWTLHCAGGNFFDPCKKDALVRHMFVMKFVLCFYVPRNAISSWNFTYLTDHLCLI